jgi:hypothetical protein
MFDAARPPVDEATTIADLTRDPYARLPPPAGGRRRCAAWPSVGRILLTKVDDCLL